MFSIPAERLQDRRTKTRWKIESFDRRVRRLFTVVVVCRAFKDCPPWREVFFRQALGCVSTVCVAAALLSIVIAVLIFSGFLRLIVYNSSCRTVDPPLLLDLEPLQSDQQFTQLILIRKPLGSELPRSNVESDGKLKSHLG